MENNNIGGEVIIENDQYEISVKRVCDDGEDVDDEFYP